MEAPKWQIHRREHRGNRRPSCPVERIGCWIEQMFLLELRGHRNQQLVVVAIEIAEKERLVFVPVVSEKMASSIARNRQR